MDKLGMPYEVIPSAFEEDMTLKMTPEELASFLSKGKAKDIAEKNPDAIVIGADTFVALDGKLLGKPADDLAAKKMLRMISGRTHEVITGFTVIGEGKEITEVVHTYVTMKELDENTIDDYIATGETKARAGSYGIQGIGRDLVAKIDGEYFNIMGLPLHALVKMLNEKFGFELDDNIPETGL